MARMGPEIKTIECEWWEISLDKTASAADDDDCGLGDFKGSAGFCF